MPTPPVPPPVPVPPQILILHPPPSPALIPITPIIISKIHTLIWEVLLIPMVLVLTMILRFLILKAHLMIHIIPNLTLVVRSLRQRARLILTIPTLIPIVRHTQSKGHQIPIIIMMVHLLQS